MVERLRVARPAPEQMTAGISPNVRDVLEGFEFGRPISRLTSKDLLYPVELGPPRSA